MLLQVGFRMMGILDLFNKLFQVMAQVIHSYSMDISIMSTFVQERFSKLRHCLLDLIPNTPFKHSEYMILLVIDEVQNLGFTKCLLMLAKFAWYLVGLDSAFSI
ncbi:hypothetical protein CPB97_002118 [Podila verticillata]|nr:hypothetical protein CPB97_002118 [Podila verticillata]